MPNVSRELWRVVEPLHQVAYRSPEATAAYERLGLAAGPEQYFANRLAALGPVGPTTAVAVLYGFAPSYVSSAVPRVWDRAQPSDIAQTRQEAACACLSRVLGATASPQLSEAADLVSTLVGLLDFAGTPLAAAWADLPAARDPLGRLWQACTVLREHRGDVHWRATASRDIDPVECHLLHAADGAMPEDLLKRVSGWDDTAWAGGKARLERRGLVTTAPDATLSLTDVGRSIKRDIESSTDAHADRAISLVGIERVLGFRERARPWVTAIMQADVIGAWKIREEMWRDDEPRA